MASPQQRTGNGSEAHAALRSVHITSDAGDVDQPEIRVSRLMGEQVTWSTRGRSATVVFDAPEGSPFQYASFEVPAGGSVSSGPATADASGPYKYTVVGHSGRNDPIVIVDP